MGGVGEEISEKFWERREHSWRGMFVVRGRFQFSLAVSLFSFMYASYSELTVKNGN